MMAGESNATAGPHLVVVGSANTDLVVSVPRIPAPGETVLGMGALSTLPGGKGANQAVAAARLGAAVTFVARIGDDAFGAQTRENLARENIDTRFVTTTPGMASGVALIAVDAASGENAIVVAPGANSHLSAGDIAAAAPAFDTADAVVLSLEVPLEAIAAAAAAGKARGLPVILNPAPAFPLPPSLLANVFLLTPNETEAAQIAGRTEPFSDVGELAALLDLGVEAAVVTLGARGAVIVTPDGIERVPGVAVRAVDTVAAGDCFTAALAGEIARGRSLRDAVQFASLAAALSVTRKGAQPSLPTRSEVAAFRATV